MIGLVLVSHGQLAVELRRSLETVVGVQSHLATVCVDPHDRLDERRAAVARAIAETDNGAGVIVAADMFGATPCNVAVSLAGRPDVDVIAGVNLPMLVEIAKLREIASLPECVTRAAAAGRHYITSASHVLAQGNSGGDRGADVHPDRPSYAASPIAGAHKSPAAPRAGSGSGDSRSPYEIGRAAAHRAAMTQNAEAPSRL